MEIKEFFIIAFAETPSFGEQSAAHVDHFTLIGYLRENPAVNHKFTIAEHIDRVEVKRLELRGKKFKRFGKYLVNLLEDPTGDIYRLKTELFEALMEDGYICTRKGFYNESYNPHVTAGPAPEPGQHNPYKKLESFDFKSLTLTESRFDIDYTFLGSEVLHNRVF